MRVVIDLSKKAKPNKTIREHTDDLLNSLEKLNRLNYLKKEIYNLMRISCEYHDYGKINNEFQKRVSSEVKINFNNDKEVAHNVLSLCFLNEELFENIDDYYRVAYAILNHHHNTDNYLEVKNKKNLIEEFINEFGGNKVKRRVLDEIAEMKTDNQAILLKGFLHKCDYSASGNYEIEYKNDFLIDSLNNNLLNDWKSIDIKSDWNEMQLFCKENQNNNIIVIANTGMGKTEAGLLWIGDNKGFFILPLKTAINAIYDRIKNKIIQKKIDERLSLLHSDMTSYYLKESVVEEEKILEYISKGKQLSLPLTISTLDQIFNFVYKYNGYELKLATMSYSKIVIDEIQAYSPELLAYLVLGLEKIVEVGGKFAILTATLAPFVRDYINENIKNIEFAKFTKGKDRHNVKVIEEEINAEFIYKHYKKNRKKVLVVCNTVKKAQEIYSELKNMDNDIKLNLLHAKFIKRDRAIKENQIIEFGKTERADDGIWVATSIVEASLDIDFDYLFTELNDLNGFFQRLGRVNRKGEKTHMLNEANVYVFTEINKALFLNENRTKGFIDKKIYELSKSALLNELNGILSEKSKNEIIEKYLNTDNIKGSNFDKYYRDVKKYTDELYIGEKKIEEVNKTFRNIISFNVIPESIYIEEIDYINEHLKILDIKYTVNKNLSNEENEKEINKLKLKKNKAKEAIKDLTVPVGIYDLNKIGKQIDLGYEKIDIVKCNYDEKIGFEKLKTEKEETYDNFF